MPDSLKNKVAIITGASRGIGAGIVERIAAEGAKVVIAARTLEADGELPGSLQETADRIRTRDGECHCVQVDLSHPVDRARMVPEAMVRFKATRGQARRHTQLAFEINYFSPLEMSHQAIESMVERGGGRPSATSRHPEAAPYDPKNRAYLFHQHMSPTLYGSTKAALERTSAGLAAELALVNYSFWVIMARAPNVTL